MRVVVIAQEEIDARTPQLLALYRSGGIVAVAEPDDERLAAWCETHGVAYAGDGGSDEGEDHHLLYAFDAQGNYYFLDDFVHDDERPSCDVVLDSFVGWVNARCAAAQPTSRGTRADEAPDLRRLFAPQTVHHTFQMCLDDKTLAHVALSKPDKLTRSGTIDVAYSIYPLHSFEANGSSAGDYYIVESTFTVHNAQMYAGAWTQKHGGVKARLCGFYLKGFEITHRMGEMKTTKLFGRKLRVFHDMPEGRVRFPERGTPVPETTIGATSYASGFQWSIGGSVSGGMIGTQGQFSVTPLNYSVGWNNSETRTVSDLTIRRNCPDGAVGYAFEINNTPHTSNGSKHTDVPAIASSDFTIRQAWIWHVPATKDYATEEHALALDVRPTYESYHWYSSAADFSTSSWDVACETFRVALLKPNRIPKGVLELVNTGAGREYMTDIRIWNEETPAGEAPDHTVAGSFRDRAASIELPQGRYRVQVLLGPSADAMEPDRTPGTVEIRLAETTRADAGFEFVPGTL